VTFALRRLDRSATQWITPNNEIIARIGAAARSAEIAITTNDRHLSRRLANLITGLLLAEGARRPAAQRRGHRAGDREAEIV
jgi:hypothetical protein